MLDCSIVKTANNLNLISTTDYFYPLVDDPYVQGRIGATNVISDIYSLGIPHIDNVLMILAASSNIKDKQHRNIVTQQMMKGFIDTCLLANTRVTGGHSVNNPWPMIGGCAQSVVSDEQYISPYLGQSNDYLVLTKPLGTQIAVNVAEWKALNSERYQQLIHEKVVSDADLERMVKIAKASMMRLNQNAARLMISDRYKKYVHGATDVTGFGILGHAQNLCIHQHRNSRQQMSSAAGIRFVIDRLPIIRYSEVVNERFDGMFKLEQGFSAETSGGLLVMVGDKKVAEDFTQELSELDAWPAWIVGQVKEHEYAEGAVTMKNCAVIADEFEYVDVFG